MTVRQITVGDRSWTVRVAGPDSRHTVLLLPDAGAPPDAFDGVCARLHVSDLRTVTPESIDGLAPADLHAVLDQLSVPYTHVAGYGRGAELAWRLCAGPFGRFISLTVADRGHPAGADTEGAVADAAVRPMELPVTMVVTKRTTRAVADGSGRFVYGEFRVVELDVDDVAAEAVHEFATEIVLRTSPW